MIQINELMPKKKKILNWMLFIKIFALNCNCNYDEEKNCFRLEQLRHKEWNCHFNLSFLHSSPTEIEMKQAGETLKPLRA